MNSKLVKLFLRLTISVGFLSAVADRFGFWSKENSAWGNWENFLNYTKVLNPLVPENLISPVAIIATALEIIFPIFLLVFGLSMAFSVGIKAPLDYSVFTGSAACFALSLMKEKYLEIDNLISNNR